MLKASALCALEMSLNGALRLGNFALKKQVNINLENLKMKNPPPAPASGGYGDTHVQTYVNVNNHVQTHCMRLYSILTRNPCTDAWHASLQPF
jgi:hypothetical protein